MAILVVGKPDVEDYGSAHDKKERVVPSGITMDDPSTPSWKTKKLLMCAGIIGMTAAVASSALLFCSIMDVSNQASIGPSFLLRDSGPYSNCLPAPGPWPGFSNLRNDDDGAGRPYITCFSVMNPTNEPGDYCWSHSYKDWDGNWHSCTPQGFGSTWKFATYGNSDGCGTPCTEFSSGLSR